MSYPSGLLGTGRAEYPRPEAKADDACFTCGYTRAQLRAKDRELQRVVRTVRPTNAPPHDGEAVHVCTACVTFFAQAAGIVGGKPRYERAITCTSPLGDRCPFGAELGLTEPFTRKSLVDALHALGWACSPSATLFTCPRCVARS